MEPCSAIPLDHQMHQGFPLCGMHVFCWDWVGTAVGMLLVGAGPQPRWLQWPASPAVVALVERACPLYNWLSPAVATIVLLVGISSLQPAVCNDFVSASCMLTCKVSTHTPQRSHFGGIAVTVGAAHQVSWGGRCFVGMLILTKTATIWGLVGTTLKCNLLGQMGWAEWVCEEMVGEGRWP